MLYKKVISIIFDMGMHAKKMKSRKEKSKRPKGRDGGYACKIFLF